MRFLIIKRAFRIIKPFLGYRNVTGLLVFCAVSIIVSSAEGKSISANGSANLQSVPPGEEKIYQTNIVGVNSEPNPAKFDFYITSGNGREFFEPLPNLNWIVTVLDTSTAPANGTTRPLSVITRFPNDSTLYNRRFVAGVEVGKGTMGVIAMSISLELTAETKPSRKVYPGVGSLILAPSVAPLREEWDSLMLYNDGQEPETVEVFWSPHLTTNRSEKKGVELSRKQVLWRFPVSIIVLEPAEGEWLFFKKSENYTGLPGYIICIGRKKSLYCELIRD
ncbi:hypothetical protein DRQ36_07530 [bacterium]|nr:MAG: hypothetical protein DRQ36_07530 [bacterium]